VGTDLAALAAHGLLRKEGDGSQTVYYFRPNAEMEQVLPEFLESVRQGSRRTEVLKIEKENAALRAAKLQLAEEITARDRSLDEARSQLAAQYRRLLFIQQINNVIIAAPNASELFGGLGRALTQAANFDAAGFLILDERVKIYLSGREGYQTPAYNWVIAAMRRHFERVLPVSMIPAETQTEILPVSLGAPVQNPPAHLVAVPLFRQKKPTGLVALARGAQLGDFAEEDSALLEIVAGQVSIAVENLYAREQVARLAITDDLTGIYNKRQFRTTLKYEVDRARIYGEPLSLIMLDIDHFKKVNDTFGHAYGDIVLSELCGTVRQQIRPTDTFARYGGEEFGVILPHTEKAGAVALAERIRKSVEQNEMPPPDGGNPQRVTVSIGVGVFEEGLGGPDDLVAIADRNLYRSKNSGRNRVSG
jgi:diguanylate cyclase (GGDEF)-like protein